MIERKSWKDFRNAGMLFFINQILHAFGWCIVVSMEDGEVKELYPARCRFRGFTEEAQDEEHRKIARYLSENAPKFPDEIKD